MNGRDKRKKRARRTASLLRLCSNGCGEPGPHFVPPSLGEPGFYICTPRPEES